MSGGMPAGSSRALRLDPHALPVKFSASDARADGAYKGSWTTPVLARVGGEDHVVCTMPTRVSGYDPVTGDILWTCDGIRGSRGDLAYSSPMIADGFCVAIGGFEGPSIGIQLGGKGDLTENGREWRAETFQSP